MPVNLQTQVPSNQINTTIATQGTITVAPTFNMGSGLGTGQMTWLGVSPSVNQLLELRVQTSLLIQQLGSGTPDLDQLRSDELYTILGI